MWEWGDVLSWALASVWRKPTERALGVSRGSWQGFNEDEDKSSCICRLWFSGQVYMKCRFLSILSAFTACFSDAVERGTFS